MSEEREPIGGEWGDDFEDFDLDDDSTDSVWDDFDDEDEPLDLDRDWDRNYDPETDGPMGEDDPPDHFTNVRGPAECPRPCEACPERRHHWLYTSPGNALDPEDEDANHPAMKEGHGEHGWLQCKHCDAWHEITEAMLNDPDFEIV